MTNTTPYNQLRQLLTERLPHLKELSFGCEIALGHHRIVKGTIVTDWNHYIIDHPRTNDYGDRVTSDKEVFLVRNIKYFENSMTSYVYEDFSEIKIEETNEETFEIIGHPPTLQDVLLAISNKIGKNYFTIDTNGRIANIDNIGVAHYDLTKNLANQSDETLLALIELIK